jgi:hypothetical protein
MAHFPKKKLYLQLTPSRQLCHRLSLLCEMPRQL